MMADLRLIIAVPVSYILAVSEHGLTQKQNTNISHKIKLYKYIDTTNKIGANNSMYNLQIASQDY